MAIVTVSDTTLTDIANAIREKLSSEDTYKPSEMADAIDSISGGGITPTGTINITENGTHDVTNYALASVAVPQGITPTGTKQISITQNGTITEDVTNYANAEIAVNVSGGSVPVPTGCELLEYVDTSGSCAVNLGQKITYPSTGYTFYLRFGVLNTSKTQIVYSSGTTVSNRTDQLVIISGGRIRMDRTSNSSQRFSMTVGDVIEVYSSYTNATNGSGSDFALDKNTNASFSAAATLYDLTPVNNMILFAEYSSNYKTYATVRFYEMYYKEGNTEIMHLYPVKDSNNVKCLYDSVNDTLIYPTVGQFAQN